MNYRDSENNIIKIIGKKKQPIQIGKIDIPLAVEKS